MRGYRWRPYSTWKGISGLLLLLLVMCTHLPPSDPPASSPGSRAGDATSDEAWSATFTHESLGQPGTLTACGRQCRLDLAGSLPSPIILDRVVDQPVASLQRLQIYAGWPRNEQGQITGVRNRSRDPASAPVHENKLGPTIVWAVSGCQQVCVQGLVLQYDLTIARGTEVIVVKQINTPTTDAGTSAQGCLSPVFRTEPGTSTTAYAGAIDQPGCTVSVDGESFKDIAGRYDAIVTGDRLATTFKHRALIICDGNVIGVTDWGYRLTATLGKPADLITPEIGDGVHIDLALQDDPAAIERAQYTRALGAAQEFLQVPEP